MGSLFALLVLALAVCIAYWVVDRIKLGEPARTVIYVVMAVVVIAFLLDLLGLYNFNLK